MQTPSVVTSVRRRAVRSLVAVALALSGAAATAGLAPDEETGELMGDLMFHADLMSTLDALCPRRGAGDDWRAVIRDLPTYARTRELQDVSRRLSADAARSMVKATGGCKTRDYAQVYAETRRDYETLLERWARYSI